MVDGHGRLPVLIVAASVDALIQLAVSQSAGLASKIVLNGSGRMVVQFCYQHNDST